MAELEWIFLFHALTLSWEAMAIQVSGGTGRKLSDHKGHLLKMGRGSSSLAGSPKGLLLRSGFT